MGEAIIDLQAWLTSPSGRYLLEWERSRLDALVSDIFGYHALQLGLPELDALYSSRMPHRWLALESVQALSPGAPLLASLHCDFAALPLAPRSLDLVVLPHTLEFSADPHAALREVERVLVPEGRVVVCGLNPWSLWGLRQWRAHAMRRMGCGSLFLPGHGQFISPGRLRDWLRLLSFEVEIAEFGCWRAAVRSERWLQRLQWMDTAGQRWWPPFGAAYVMVAVKRVRGMRLLEPAWRTQSPRVSQPVGVAQGRSTHKDGWECKL